MNLKKKEFSPDAYQAMMEHQWPGNVRELMNFIERLAIMSQAETISAEQIRLFLSPQGNIDVVAHKESPIRSFLSADYRTAKKMFEKEYLQRKLIQNDNNISKTAEQVGLERSHLHKKLKAFEII